MCRAEEEEEEPGGGGDGRNRRRGFCWAAAWFPGRVGRARARVIHHRLPRGSFGCLRRPRRGSRGRGGVKIVNSNSSGAGSEESREVKQGSALSRVGASSGDGPSELAVAAQVDRQEPRGDRDLGVLSIREDH